jgi:cold shock CspA family protein
MEGIVKFFNPQKHFGFIQIEDEPGNVVGEFFFHGHQVIGDKPRKGDLVEFWIVDPRHGGGSIWEATDVLVKGATTW